MIEKEKYWDPSMSTRQLDRILSLELFKKIDQSQFPSKLSIEEIICRHTRMQYYLKGEVIIRANDYGNSAFLIDSGVVGVILPTTVPEEVFGKAMTQPTNWFKEISKLWKNPSYSEVGQVKKNSSNVFIVNDESDDRARVFVKRFSAVFEQIKEFSINLSAGDMVGEIAALSRSPRTAHVIAFSECVLLEIRWQGIKALRKYDKGFREHIDALYKKNSLDTLLRTLPFFSRLKKNEQNRVLEHTLYESYGELSWLDDSENNVDEEHPSLLKNETLIVAEGDYADGLLLIRSGIARASHSYKHGYRILKYLNKGDKFGFRTLIYNWKNKKNIPLPANLHAIGYTEVLRVPSFIVEELVLSKMTKNEIDIQLSQLDLFYGNRRKYPRDIRLADGLLDFMSHHRYVNGSASMVIDLDRCVRCDDCVNACAVGHNNNPRFIRHGRQYDHFMVANACMHCHDPVCMIGCPTGAIHREPTGQITISENVCIGCSTCANSCPYENIKMIQTRDEEGEFIHDEISLKQIIKASKCDLCVDQLDGPACQRACPHDALKRIDFFSLSTLVYEARQFCD